MTSCLRETPLFLWRKSVTLFYLLAMIQNEQGNAPRIDFSRMEQVVDTSSEMRELIELYLRSTGEQLMHLQAAIAAYNADEVRRLAHTAAGASATCGIDSIVPIFKEMESNARKGTLDQCEGLRRQAESEFNEIKKSLHQHLANL